VGILGELAMSGAVPAAIVATRYVVRDVLEHRRDLEVLRRTPDDQLADVVRALGAMRRRTHQ
jgi:hypothetical protein